MVDFTEEMILNENFQKMFPGLRMFRIEYGFECSCPEGIIYLPKEVDPDFVEEFLNKYIHFKCPCHA